MSEQGLNRILDLCQEALARPADQRKAFLDEACPGGTEVRRAVEKMLADSSGENGFLADPAWAPPPQLAAGARMGPYEIQSFIGAGGMGVVYKALDTRLGRTVAIKVLSAAVAAADEWRARFEREARTIAGLNHPNVCALYDVGHHAGSAFLVMEHIEGETLAARLSRGPLPVQHAIVVAAQVADAMAAAHRQGISHGDLKPANVMLTRRPRSTSGPWEAKLLDFGLSKLSAPDRGEMPAETGPVPTGQPRTGAGRMAGTVPYMAPEQFAGEGDSRSDIFAFGAVLYEMLTGRRAFDGDSQSAVISAILSAEPAPLSSLQPQVPSALDRLVRKCLAKDPEARWQNAADLADTLRWLAGDSAADAARPPKHRRRAALTRAAIVFLMPALGAGAIGALLWRSGAPPSLPGAVRLQLSLAQFPASPAGPVMSPAGDVVVFRATDGPAKPIRLYAYSMRDGEVQALEGTDGANGACFSPDGAWLAFASETGLWRVSRSGGPPVRLLAAKGVHPRISWTPDGYVLFCYRVAPAGVWQVSARGGAATVLVPGRADVPDLRYRAPRMLPDGDAVLLTTIEAPRLRERRLNVVAFSLKTRETTTIAAGAEGRYVPATGHLIYLADGNLLAAAFDSRSLTLTGEPVAVERDVGRASGGDTMGSNTYDVSDSGTLVYTARTQSVLAWRDRRGNERPLAVTVRGSANFLSLSRDGRRAVLMLRTETGTHPYTANLDGGDVTLTSFTDGPQDWFGTFTCDGTRLLFSRVIGRQEFANVFSMPIGRRGEARQQTIGTTHGQKASSFACPGDTFLYNNYTNDEGDIWQQRLDRPDTAKAVVTGVGNQKEAVFSPDGRWIAYSSDSAGRAEVFVTGYPSGPTTLISEEGGDLPVWNPKGGGELFYQVTNAVVSVRVLEGRRQGPPTTVFEAPYEPGQNRMWDVMPDGERFLVAEPRGARHMNVVLNWLNELKWKAPPR